MLSSRLENVTQTISTILQGYDIRLRPNFGREPLHVGMDLTIASFDAISEVNMVDITINNNNKNIHNNNNIINYAYIANSVFLGPKKLIWFFHPSFGSHNSYSLFFICLSRRPYILKCCNLWILFQCLFSRIKCLF